MAINFTDSPADGATQVISGRTYTYNSAKNKWDTTATEVVGPTAKTYATVNDLPGTALTGDQAFVSGTNRLYIWNGSGWYNIALINTTPTWTTQPDSSYTLASDGTATTITIVATDPEGLPITYSIASDTSGNTATVTQNANVFTITPSTNDANAGTFSLTFRASDGVNIASAISEFTLQFKVVNSNYTTALITSVGTNNQVNNTFVDSSTNSHTITAAGNATQTTFSPYRHGGYSTYLTTNTSYVRSPTSADFDIGGTGDWAYEAWVYVPSSHSFATYARAFGLGPFYNNSKSFGLNISDGAHSNYITVYWDDDAGLGRKLISSTTFDKGQWNHLLVARSGNSIGLFYNGTRIASNDSYTNAIDAGNTYLFVGHTGNGTEGSQEYIKSLRFINGSHPYDASASSITTPSEDLEEVTNTKFLLGQKPYLVDESSNSHALTTSGTISIEPFAPYDYETYSAADNGGSMYFDGTGDFVSVADHADLDMGSSDFTIEGWYHPITSPSSANGLLSKRANSSVVGGVLIYFASSSPTPSLLVDIGGSWGINSASSIPFKVGMWNHFAVVRNGASFKLYINGQAGVSVTNSGTISDNASAFVIGAMGADGSNPIAQCNIADFRVVKGTAVYTADFTPPTAPLTAITNTSLLINGTNAGIIDKSQSNKLLTLTGNIKSSTTQTKYLTSSMYFDGNGDYLTLPNNLGTNYGSSDFTVETWVYKVANPSTDAGIVDQRPASSNGLYFMLGINSEGQLFIYVNGAYRIGPSLSTAINTNTWYHVAYARSSGTGTLYIDGASVGSWSDNTNYSNGGGFIGHHAYAASDFNGYLSDVRITKGLARYTANFTPPAAALQG